jgi:hypothetical protein
MKPEYLLAMGVILASLVAMAPLTAQPAPPQPMEQQKLNDRVVFSAESVSWARTGLSGD